MIDPEASASLLAQATRLLRKLMRGKLDHTWSHPSLPHFTFILQPTSCIYVAGQIRSQVESVFNII